MAKIELGLEEVSYKEQHPTPVDDADPKEERHCGECLGGERRILAGGDGRGAAGKAGTVIDDDVDAGEHDEEHLQPEGGVVDVLKGITRQEREPGGQIDEEAEH